MCWVVRNPGALVDGFDRRDCIKTWESTGLKVLAGGKKLLSPGDEDDRSPSRMRGIFQEVWLMARDTSWQNSTDLDMMASFERKKGGLSWWRVALWAGLSIVGVRNYFNGLVAYRGANSRTIGKGMVYDSDSSKLRRLRTRLTCIWQRHSFLDTLNVSVILFSVFELT